MLITTILVIPVAKAGDTLTPRENYERHRAEAAAALSRGKIADATTLATRAFSQLPDGSKVTFDPGENNVVVTITYASSNKTHQLTLALSQFKAWLDEHDYWGNFTSRPTSNYAKSVAPFKEQRKEQRPQERAADLQIPSIDANKAARANGGYASMSGWNTVVTPESVGTGNPQYRWERIPQKVRRGPFDHFDPEDVAVALAMFPSQGPKMWQWLQDQKNIKLDRQRGNSHSIGVSVR